MNKKVAALGEERNNARNGMGSAKAALRSHGLNVLRI
jgi:hypothetical protein